MNELSQIINGGQFYQGLFTGLVLGAVVGGLGVLFILEVGTKRGWFEEMPKKEKERRRNAR